MRLHHRLRRLEERLPAHVGCRACQDRRGRLVLVTSRREPDGSIVPVEDRPTACAECGLVPEFLIVILKPVGDDGGAES
jgi:hypothetical protein